MDSNALNALRSYTASTKPAVTTNADIQQSAKGGQAPGKLAEAAAEFAQVFDTAEQQALAATTGKADPQTVVEAMASAELALQTAVTIRDKVVEAYQELLRMPI